MPRLLKAFDECRRDAGWKPLLAVDTLPIRIDDDVDLDDLNSVRNHFGVVGDSPNRARAAQAIGPLRMFPVTRNSRPPVSNSKRHESRGAFMHYRPSEFALNDVSQWDAALMQYTADKESLYDTL